jgi:hypothetical protein
VTQAEQDAWLDAVAFVAATHHDDQEGLTALLDANWGCPMRLESLIRALGLLAVHALEGDPPCDVDEALAVARRFVLEQP